MTEQVKRRPGRPPLEEKEYKKQVHLYIPASLVEKAKQRRGNVPLHAYILQLIKDDVQKGSLFLTT